MKNPQLPCGMESDRIQEYLDGALAREVRGGFEAHLAGCPACSAELASLQRLYARLSSLPLFAPDLDFDRAVLSVVLPERRRAFGLSPVVWFGAAYVVFTAALLLSAMVLSGALPVNGQVSPFAEPWHQSLHAALGGIEQVRGAWELTHKVLSPLGVLGGLGQVAARLVFAVVSTPDGRFYLALAAITALAFLGLARRPQKGGSLATSAI